VQLWLVLWHFQAVDQVAQAEASRVVRATAQTNGGTDTSCVARKPISMAAGKAVNAIRPGMMLTGENASYSPARECVIEHTNNARKENMYPNPAFLRFSLLVIGNVTNILQGSMTIGIMSYVGVGLTNWGKVNFDFRQPGYITAFITLSIK